MCWLSASSFGKLTYVGVASSSILALKYALVTSTNDIWVRLGDCGFQSGLYCPTFVIAKLKTVRRASIGGAGAKND